jgi:hypothetical protein
MQNVVVGHESATFAAAGTRPVEVGADQVPSSYVTASALLEFTSSRAMQNVVVGHETTGSMTEAALAMEVGADQVPSS